MTDFDDYTNILLEQSKRFLEIAKAKQQDINGLNAYLNASLLLSISSLEAFVNGIANDFSESRQFSIFELAFLIEKEVEFKSGSFKISNRLKMSRLIERIELLFEKFSTKINKDESWWSNLIEGIRLRNDIVHPKDSKELKIEEVERTIYSIINCINLLFKAIYKQGLPSLSLGLNSTLDF